MLVPPPLPMRLLLLLLLLLSDRWTDPWANGREVSEREGVGAGFDRVYLEIGPATRQKMTTVNRWLTRHQVSVFIASGAVGWDR